MQKGKVALENLYEKYGFLNLYHIIKFKRKYWKQNLSKKLKTKFKFGITEKIQTKFKLRPKYSSTCILNYPSLLTL
jgi:hypothetical protein